MKNLIRAIFEKNNREVPTSETVAENPPEDKREKLNQVQELLRYADTHPAEVFAEEMAKESEIDVETLKDAMREYLKKADGIFHLPGSHVTYEESQNGELAENELYLTEELHGLRKPGGAEIRYSSVENIAKNVRYDEGEELEPWGDVVPAGYIDADFSGADIAAKGKPAAFYPNTFHLKKITLDSAEQRQRVVDFIEKAKKVAEMLSRESEGEAMFAGEAYMSSRQVHNPTQLKFRTCKLIDGKISDVKF